MLQDVERLLDIRVAVGIVRTQFEAREVELGGFVEAGGQFVGEAVSLVGVAAPAGGVVPFLAVDGGVYVDGDMMMVSWIEWPIWQERLLALRTRSFKGMASSSGSMKVTLLISRSRSLISGAASWTVSSLQ